MDLRKIEGKKKQVVTLKILNRHFGRIGNSIVLRHLWTYQKNNTRIPKPPKRQQRALPEQHKTDKRKRERNVQYITDPPRKSDRRSKTNKQERDEIIDGWIDRQTYSLRFHLHIPPIKSDLSSESERRRDRITVDRFGSLLTSLSRTKHTVTPSPPLFSRWRFLLRYLYPW